MHMFLLFFWNTSYIWWVIQSALSAVFLQTLEQWETASLGGFSPTWNFCRVQCAYLCFMSTWKASNIEMLNFEFSWILINTVQTLIIPTFLSIVSSSFYFLIKCYLLLLLNNDYYIFGYSIKITNINIIFLYTSIS